MVIDHDFSSLIAWDHIKGEEHIPPLLHNESGLVDKMNLNLATDVRVPGRLKGHHEVYKEIGADDYIVELIENGYKLVFDEVPPKSYTRNNKSALMKNTFVYDELMRLEKLGCIKRVSSQPHEVLPLSVVYSKSGV